MSDVEHRLPVARTQRPTQSAPPDPRKRHPMTTAPAPLVTGPADGPWRELSVGDRIKEYIVANHLRPGDPLPTEHELSERLRVSRSRVREAVKTLSALDIVEVRHGYGTYVGRMSLDALVQSLAFRSMLKPDEGQHVLADLIDIRELIETSLA